MAHRMRGLFYSASSSFRAASDLSLERHTFPRGQRGPVPALKRDLRRETGRVIDPERPSNGTLVGEGGGLSCNHVHTLIL